MMGRKMQYHLSIARHVTFKMEIFPNVNRACLLLRTRQKNSPAKPRGTGKESMLITKLGVRGIKIPVDNKDIELLFLMFELQRLTNETNTDESNFHFNS